MESPTEKFLSHKALLTVTQRIGLEMSEKDLQLLKKNTTVTPRRGTDYIDITVKHSPREEAIRIANAIAEVGVERAANTEKNRAKRFLETLDGEIMAQSNLVDEHRKNLTVLIQQFVITPPYTNETPRERLTALQTQRDEIKTLYKALSKQSDDKLIHYAAALDLPESKVATYYQQYQNLSQKRTALIKKGIEKNHHDITAIDQKMKLAWVNASKEVASLNAVLETKLNLVERQIVRLTSTIENSPDNTIEQSLQQNDYNQAKEIYEQSRDFLREMESKQQEARVHLNKPHYPLTIHERAQ